MFPLISPLIPPQEEKPRIYRNENGDPYDDDIKEIEAYHLGDLSSL